ncbi:hypothetical protein [Plantactinospora veratri]
MVSTSLVDQVAALRRGCTGESNTAATEAVRPTLQRLARPDRGRVVDALRADYSSDAPWSAWSQPPMPDLRELLLPSAASGGQQELECGLLDSISGAADALHCRPPASLLRPATVLRHLTITATGVLGVRVDEPALGPLLVELLPAPFDGELRGVPGLRYRQHKRKGELYLIDAAPAARIMLTAVTPPVARRALDYVSGATQLAVDEVRSTLQAKHLTPVEQDWMQRHSRTPGDPALASALLRRMFTLGRPLWFTTWSNGMRRVLWPAGHTSADVARRLTHPLLGLPGVYRTEEHDKANTEVRDASSDNIVGRRGLLLTREAAPTAEFDRQLRARTVGREPTVAWQQWFKAHSARAANTR